jgi:hypothetical protein
MTTLSEIKIYKQRLKTYKQEFHKFLLTSRFNNLTWNENENYRKKNQKLGCIYCSPQQISNSIPLEAVMFILEMNNDINKILGIGMVRNHPLLNKYHVYENGNYNRYSYVGKNRIDRKDMTEKEEEIMKFFDIICFSGNKHMKRGQGLKAFPADILYRCSKELDLVEFISNMFKSRLAHNKEINN